MDRAEWLKKIYSQAEALYDRLGTTYWARWGKVIAPTHKEFITKFLSRLKPQSTILSAACGAGLNDGILVEAGHTVLGIDQSAGMLARAQEHYPVDRFPTLRYERVRLQDMDFWQLFDGATCIDGMEHDSPEDWPVILDNFHRALKPEGLLYLTVDATPLEEIRKAYEKAIAQGLPVVFGEVVDRLDASYAQVMTQDALTAPSELFDPAVYHYHPSMDQVRTWFAQAGFTIEEEGTGEEYVHLLARKHPV